jgi:hypothetical protein
VNAHTRLLLLVALVTVPGAVLAAEGDPDPPDDEAAVSEPPPAPPGRELEPVATRWRSYDYQGRPEYTFRIYDPYGQNVLKADFPVAGDWFVEVNALANLVYKSRENLDFRPAFADQIAAGTLTFTGRNDFANQNLLVGAELRRFEDAFYPSTFRFRVNGVADHRSDINAFNPGSNSDERLFDAFFDVVLHDFGDPTDGKGNFDLLVLRGGLQGFRSDFHGLVFNDVGLGGRLFGEAKRNRLRYDLVVLDLYQKDPISGFNDFSPASDHQVAVARLAWDDLMLGWNGEWSLHANRDRREVPGVAREARHGTWYLGSTFNGHLGRVTFNPALYGVFGHADHAVAGALERHTVRAWLALLDAQLEFDYWNFRAACLVASGDGDPADDRDTGFDAISDGVTLFGGPLSYWVGENIRFGRGNFVRGNSFLPALRGVNDPANHVNPGLHLLNLGVDMTLSPRLDAAANLSYLRFAATADYGDRVVIGHRPAAVEGSLFVRLKPFLRRANQNVLLDLGASTLRPASGLEDAFGSDDAVVATFFAVRLVY